MDAPIYLTGGSSESGEVGEPLGPFEHVVLTFTLVRAAPLGGDGDALTIGSLHTDGLWHMDDGQVWTDLTLNARLED